ncbi:hypothetical protein SRHO_G00116250 [Serrasalmus rhombeus]
MLPGCGRPSGWSCISIWDFCSDHSCAPPTPPSQLLLPCCISGTRLSLPQPAVPQPALHTRTGRDATAMDRTVHNQNQDRSEACVGSCSSVSLCKPNNPAQVLLSAYKCQPLPLSAAGCAAKMDYPLISAVRRRSGLARLMHTEWGNDFTFLQKLVGPVPELLYSRARFIMNRNQTHTRPGTRSVNTVLRLNRRRGFDMYLCKQLVRDARKM